jgi:hypothetical protein
VPNPPYIDGEPAKVRAIPVNRIFVLSQLSNLRR